MAKKRPPRVRTPTPPNGQGAPRKPLMPAASPAPGMFHIAFAGAALCLLVAVSYVPALWAGFVWDDVILTRARPLHTWSGLAQIWFTPRALMQYEGHYWPLLYTTFWLEHKLWGLAPLGYHLVNLLLAYGGCVCCCGTCCGGWGCPARGLRRRCSRCIRCTWSRWSGSSGARTSWRPCAISPPCSPISASRKCGEGSGEGGITSWRWRCSCSACLVNPPPSPCRRRCCSGTGGGTGA